MDKTNNAEKINQLLVLALRLSNEDLKLLSDGIVSRLSKEPKQETEEAAKKFKNNYAGDEISPAYEGFIEGSKWKQEQILQFLYSEITERRPYSASKMCEEVIKFIEQF